MPLSALYANYGKCGQGRHSSQQIIGGVVVQTITQQHLAASALGASMAVKPPTKIARKAISRIIALNFFIRSHLLVAFAVEVVAVTQVVAVLRQRCGKKSISKLKVRVKLFHIVG